MKEVLTIQVILNETLEVNSDGRCARMILFGGRCDCENFSGKILAGGVDTQKMEADGGGMLSARYMLEGTDREGRKCRLFIENNGEMINGEVAKTRPVILTDSEALKWLESAKLCGTITGMEDHILIRIFAL